MISRTSDARSSTLLGLKLRYVQLLSLCGLILLWGCSPEESTPTPTTVSVPTPSATPTPVAHAFTGSVTLVSPAAPTHLDVHQAVAEAFLSMGPGIAYSRLVRLSSGADADLPGMAIECDLCVRWEQPDPLTYVLHLRQGVRWHDIQPVNGRFLTAADVAFSLERLRTPGWPGASLLQAMASVEAVDDLTVRVRLSYPDADFLLALAHGQSKIVAPEAVELHGDLREGPTIGTGPWVLGLEELAGRSRFEANPVYYEPNLPGLERMDVVPILEVGERLAAVLTGRADLAPVGATEWDYLLAREPSVRRSAFPQPGSGVLLGLNTTAPPFNQLNVRQALFQAVDPWSALDKAWRGLGDVSVGVPIASSDWLLSQEIMRGYFADPSRAGELLDAAGGEAPVEFTLAVADYGDAYLELGAEYVRMLQANGFRPVLNRVIPTAYAEQVWGAGDFQAFLGPMPPVHAPNGFLLGVLHSEGRWSPTGYADEELDLLLEEQSIAGEKRGEMVVQIQKRVLEQAVLFMPATGTSLWVWQERVEGFAPNFASSEYCHWARLRVTG